MGKMFRDLLARSCSVRAATTGVVSLFLLTAALFLPGTAAAVADLTNMWPATPTIVSNSNAGTVSGKFSVGIGANRVMVVAVATRYSALPGVTPVISVNYGGQPLTAGPTTGNVQNGVALFYLKDTGANNIGLATSKTLTVTNTTTTNLTNMYATASAYNGIDQTTTFAGTGAATGLTTAAGSVASGSYAMAGSYGLAGNESLTLYVSNWNGNSNPSSVTGYTEIRDFAGSGGVTNNINLAAGYKFSTGTGNENPSSTATSNLGGIAAMTLNTLQKPAINNSCGDCHGNPPEDVVSRGAITGMFVGSHDKHAGGNEGQYGMACTYCHYNNTTYNHSQGYKNITGAKLPGNAYTATGGKRVADSNSPALGTCNNTYCHSTGRTAAQYTAPPNWGTNGTVTCLSCHAGRTSAGGAMANSSLGFKLSTTHMQHMKAPYTAANVSCNICHSKTTADAATLKQYTGVNYHANGTPDVKFTNIAYASYTSYKTGSKTCSNVSCHGGKTRGAWSTSTINNDNTCVHCHGVATTTPADTNRNKYAPGWGGSGISTDGNLVSSDPRVGGHFKHLSSAYMAKKIKCNECHLVPSNPYDAGHFDSPRFSSQTIVFSQSSTANKNTTTPAYTSGSAAVAATCNTTYCHGSKMPKGDNTGTDKSPLWNAALTAATPDTATCGRCHGNPPLFGSSSSAHIGSTATTSCIGCHKSVVDATGKMINKSLHLNGAVEVLVDTTLTAACNKCHGNPPQALKYGRYSGLVKPATLIMGASPANAGAHLKHKNNGMTCNTCHSNFNAGTHPDNKLQIFFRISSSTHTGWNTTSPRAPYGTYSGNSGGNAPVDTVSSTLVRGTASTLNSCNVYCHGAWTGSSKTSNPRWTGTATCGSCHGATAATPPAVGTHARHAGYSSALTARQGYSFSCNKCHSNRSANDHVKGAVHVRFSTAVLGTNASYVLSGASLSTPTGSRLYLTNRLAGTLPDGSCANISCHSNGRGANMGTFRNATTPTWGTTSRNCLYCHGGRTNATGTPARSTKGFTLSTTHYQHLKYPAANINCQTCHSQTAKDAASLKDFSGVKRHINNKRDVTFSPSLPYGTYTSYKSSESGSTGTSKTCNNVSCHGGKTRNAWSATATNNDNTCLHCHGYGTGAGTALRADKYNAAPGWGGTGISTDGNTAATDIRVGAHFKHLSSIYTKKIKCNECHTVPSGPFDGTHMATARYNSQTLIFSQASTATKNSVVPAFTAGTSVAPATCTTTYCHGSSLKNGDTAGTARSPQWNQDLTTGGNCGKCHGNPPNSVTTQHNGVTPTTGCGGCHSMVVNGSGTIINKALHMNGTVEAVTACNGCHSYLPTDTWTSSFGVEGASFNAHSKHINYLIARTPGTVQNKDTDTFGGATFQVTCGVCHTWDSAQHSTGGGGSRLINFGTNSTARQFGTSHPKYNGVSGTSSSVNPKSCSNIDCHYRTSPVWSTW